MQNPDAEQIQKYSKNKKLEEIFAPHAAKLRNQFHQVSVPASLRFVHYTSAEAALKIIRQKRLWLRSSACMSDYREVQHGFDHLLNFFSDQSRLVMFKNTVDSVAPGAADRALANFNGWWRSGTIQYKTFIASVSEHSSNENHHGRLSMWRAFGGNTARVGLILNVPKISPGADAMKLIFSPVTYVEGNEGDSLVMPVIENVRANQDYLKTLSAEEVSNWLFYMILVIVTCTKHVGFHEEREWRVVHSPLLFPTPLIKSSTEVVAGIPQVVCHLPLDKSVDPCLDDLDFAKLFDRMIIGPSPYPLTMAEAFIEPLLQAGISDARDRIILSDIPIRTA